MYFSVRAALQNKSFVENNRLLRFSYLQAHAFHKYTSQMQMIPRVSTGETKPTYVFQSLVPRYILQSLKLCQEYTKQHEARWLYVRESCTHKAWTIATFGCYLYVRHITMREACTYKHTCMSTGTWSHDMTIRMHQDASACICERTHARANLTRIHAQTDTHANIQSHGMHTRAHAQDHMRLHTHMRVHSRRHRHTHTHTHTHLHIPKPHMHAKPTRMHTDAHTHTHIHTCSYTHYK